MSIYVSKDGQQYGPYTVEQLRAYVQQGNFTAADHACYDGKNWVTVGEVPGFAAGGDSVATPQQPQAVQQLAASSVSGSKKKKIVLWSSIGGIAALLAAGLLIWLLGGEEGVPESNQSSAETPPAKTAEVAKIDLDDNETRNRIIAKAIDYEKLEERGKEGEELYYALNQQKPYSGWTKMMRGNGQIESLAQYKDGKLDGPGTYWYSNGRKMGEDTFEDGKLVTTVGWKPNGDKCPDTNVVDGNGVMVNYNDDGTEDFRDTYKDGVGVGTIFFEYYSNGQKESESTWKDGKLDGPQTMWYGNGQKALDETYKDGKLMSTIGWKPNGEKCPVTNVKDGNGAVVSYDIDGTEKSRTTFKDGEYVED